MMKEAWLDGSRPLSYCDTYSDRNAMERCLDELGVAI